MTDIAIIGAGPAGVSAALTAKARNKSVFLVSNDPMQSPLARAERIDNYPGLARVSGAEMTSEFKAQLDDAGIEIVHERVISIMPFGDGFMLSVGSEVQEAGAVILAIGASQGKELPGERKLLGKGVSYCATCDGMLYRGRTVCVVGKTDEAQKEANFLAEIGCNVTFISSVPAPLLIDKVAYRLGRRLEIVGEETVEGIKVDDELIPCDAVFVLRPSIAPENLIAGLETEGPNIKVDASMRTNIPGVFAAGDCTGKPLQIAVAVGEGQLAAFGAVQYLDEKKTGASEA